MNDSNRPNRTARASLPAPPSTPNSSPSVRTEKTQATAVSLQQNSGQAHGPAGRPAVQTLAPSPPPSFGAKPGASPPGAGRRSRPVPAVAREGSPGGSRTGGRPPATRNRPAPRRRTRTQAKPRAPPTLQTALPGGARRPQASGWAGASARPSRRAPRGPAQGRARPSGNVRERPRSPRPRASPWRGEEGNGYALPRGSPPLTLRRCWRSRGGEARRPRPGAAPHQRQALQPQRPQPQRRHREPTPRRRRGLPAGGREAGAGRGPAARERRLWDGVSPPPAPGAGASPSVSSRCVRPDAGRACRASVPLARLCERPRRVPRGHL